MPVPLVSTAQAFLGLIQAHLLRCIRARSVPELGRATPTTVHAAKEAARQWVIHLRLFPPVFTVPGLLFPKCKARLTVPLDGPGMFPDRPHAQPRPYPRKVISPAGTGKCTDSGYWPIRMMCGRSQCEPTVASRSWSECGNCLGEVLLGSVALGRRDA